jgi:hypothetical protein
MRELSLDARQHLLANEVSAVAGQIYLLLSASTLSSVTVLSSPPDLFAYAVGSQRIAHRPCAPTGAL